MRAALLATSLVLAFATPGFAQMQSGSPGQGYQNDQSQMGQHDGMWRHNEGREGSGPWAMMGHRFGHEHMEMMMRVLGALSSGTFYRYRRGNVRSISIARRTRPCRTA